MGRDLSFFAIYRELTDEEKDNYDEIPEYERRQHLDDGRNAVSWMDKIITFDELIAMIEEELENKDFRAVRFLAEIAHKCDGAKYVFIRSA
jgi:hypothetical protein